MKFRSVVGRFPRMRADQDFTVCPGSAETPHLITIQSEKRIARVNTQTGKTTLSDGKGGHQGFAKLQAFCGATEIDTPQWLTDQLAALEADHGPNDTGEVDVTPGSNSWVTARTTPEPAGTNIFDL